PSDVKVGRETSQCPEIAKNISASASQLKWENSANLFWLGSDLEWTSQTVLREAPRDKILHGLRQCQHHSAELGLTDTGPGRELNALKSEVTNTSDANINRKWRIDFSEKVYAVVRGSPG